MKWQFKGRSTALTGVFAVASDEAPAGERRAGESPWVLTLRKQWAKHWLIVA